MILPTIHLNGTSRKELVKLNLDAAQAVEAAITALCKAAPHGRDYYPQGDGALKAAETEFDSRLARLKSVGDELRKLAEAIYG